MIVIHPPPINNVSRLSKAEEQFTVQALIAELAVEALDVAVLPRAAMLDEQRADSGLLEPLPNGLGGELRPVVTADVLRTSSNSK